MIKLSRKVLCVEWDQRALRLVVARLGGGEMALEDAHSHRLPKAVDPDNPQALGEFIHQMLRRHHWRHTRVVVAIPREKAVINRLTLPPTPAHEVAAAVHFQAMKELPFPLEGAVVDYVVLTRDESGLATEILLAAVPLDALEAVQATCEAAGLVPARIGLRPYANLVSVSHLVDLADRRVLFVDVGPTMTEIDVMVNGQLAFARSANVNVPMLSHASEDSRSALITDLTDLDTTDEAIEAAVREVTVEITRTLQAYRATEPDAVLDRLVIAGGTGVEAHLLEAAVRRFGLDSVMFDPTEALAVSSADAGKLRSFSAALGLAWGLSRDGSLAIDFLNPKRPIPPRAALKRRLRIAGIAAGVVLAAAVATDATLYMRQSAECAARRRVVNNLKKKLERHYEIENLVEEVEDWQYQAVWPELLLTLTQQAVDPGKSMLVPKMTFERSKAAVSMRKMLASSLQVASEFADGLNKVRVNGAQAYLAKVGRWQHRSGTIATKLTGMVDVDVELLDLKQHLEERQQRVKQRKNKLKLKGL